jgi:hypothetical protein
MRVVPPKRRLELYKAMLAFIENWNALNDGVYPFGFCYALNKVKTRVDPPIYQNLSRYPELREYRPADRSYSLKASGYWFERGTVQGAEIRKKILNTIIVKLDNEIKNGTM